MNRLAHTLRLWLRLSTATVTFGLAQAVLETAAVALLYRDLLFAPYRFFTLQIYDAFTKIYFLASSYAPIPPMLDEFLGVGMLAKLRLLPELAAVNTLVALLLALVILPFAGRLGLHATLPRKLFVRRVVVVLSLVVVAVHVASWGVNVKLPADPTFRSVATNLMRDALLDGVIVALAVGALAGACTAWLPPSGLGAVVAATVLAAAGLTPRAVAEPAPAVERDVPGAPAAGYNVILVSIDSLRADHLGTYGYRRATSPSIDRLAAQGVTFERCSSTTSWTLPAHMSMLTGRSLLGHGVVGDDRRLDESVPTLAGAFQAAGYATGAVVSAPYLGSRFGFAAGFDDYDDRTISFDTNEESYKSITAPLVNEIAERWLTEHSSKPFFLFLHYWDVHYDYAPGPPYETMFDPEYRGSITGSNFYFNPAVNKRMDRRDLEHLVALYDGEIRLVDDHVERLRAALEKMGLARKTVLVVTADHGDEFFEHGNKGHHRTLYEEVLHVPWVIYVPDGRIPPQRISAEASIVDVMPTLLGLTGVAAPPGLEGNDFTTSLLGSGKPESHRAVFAELYRKGSLNVQVAALSDREKLIQHFNVRRAESYDLTADPLEHKPRALREPTAQSLFSVLRDWLGVRWRAYSKREHDHGIRHAEIDAKTAETLRSLGYIQ